MKNLTLVTLAALALAGCNKSDDSKGGGNGVNPASFVGVWTYESSFSESKFKNHIETIDTNYTFLEVTAKRELVFYISGSIKQPNEVIWKYGKVKPTVTDTATVEISEEMINEGRAAGAKEEDIQAALANPCTLKLVGADKAEFSCPSDKGERNVSKLVRSTANELQTKRSALKLSEGARSKQEAIAKSVLGGKKFVSTGTKSKSTTEGKEPFEYETKPDATPEESGTGENLYVNVKTIEFAADLKTARLNGKHTADIRLDLLKSLNGVKLAVLLKRTENSWVYSLQGKLEATADGGFTLTEDSSYEKTRSFTVTTFKPAP